MIDEKQVKHDLLAEGVEDFLGLWEFVWHARDSLGASDPASAKKAAMRMVQEFLSDGLVVAGEPVAGGPAFAEWKGSPAEVVARIESAWRFLGRDPVTADIVWFVTTPAGREWVDQYRKDRGLPAIGVSQ